MKFGFFGSTLPIEQYSASRIVMYETHFGLNKKPFRALATGSDVFVGPQTPWGWIGVVPLVTGLLGNCPVYSLLGISTCPVKR